MSKIQIQPIRPEDRAVWQTLWDGYLDFYESAVPSEVYDSTFSRLLGDAPYDPYGLIAWMDGQAVGLVHYMYHRHCWQVANVCYLQDLFADPNCRGQGIGRKLIEAVYTAADAAGCPNVYWNTAEDNYAGRMLYDRIGSRTPFIKYKR